jgi:hypothetical protein
MVTTFTTHSQKSMLKQAALQKVTKLLVDMVWKGFACAAGTDLRQILII